MMKKSLVRSVLLTAALGLLILPAMADGPTMTIVGPWEADELYLDPNGGSFDVEIHLSGFSEGLAAFVTQLEFVGGSSADPDIAPMGHTEGDAENPIADNGEGLAGYWAGLDTEYAESSYTWAWPIIGAESEPVYSGDPPEVTSYNWTTEPDRHTIGILNFDLPPVTTDPVFSDDTLVMTVKYDYAAAAVGTYTIGAIAGETMFVNTGETEIAVTVVPGTAVVRPGPDTWPNTRADANLDTVLNFADVGFIYTRFMTTPAANVKVGDEWKYDVNGDGVVNFADVGYAYNTFMGN